MLHLSKVAKGIASLELLEELYRAAPGDGPLVVSARYLPTRHAEIAGSGSLFWIVKHRMVARSPILGFGDADGGRVAFLLGRELVRVQPRPKRAHQGWRYLDPADAPVDLGDASDDLSSMPPALLGRLASMGLV